MATIKGIWKFNEELNLVDIDQIVNFSCGDYTNQTEIQIIVTDTDNRIMLKPAFTNIYRAESGWSNEKYQVIDFGKTEQEVSDEFANWLFQNANNGKVVFPSVNEGNIKVPIKENGTTTLATAGTYCVTDIDVNVEVEDKSEEAFEAGKKSEYDAFWDEYQNHGNYEDDSFSSERLFAFSRWTDKNFFPKYDIKIGPGDNGTAYYLFASSQITNLTQRLKDCKVVLDTSNAKAGNEMFAWCPLLTHVPTISLIGMKDSNARYIFAGSPNLIEIEQIILPSEGFSGGIQYWFNGAKSLVTLNIQGTILQEGFDISPAIKLSKASITSIINALSDTTTNLSVTFSLTAVNNAFETTEGAADGSTSEEWLALTETKSNWTISLV